MKRNLLASLRDGKELSFKEQLSLIINLSIPAILAQISSIIMQYIDASMVGHLGSYESASIGLVASSTWLMGSLCSACSTGFTVQVAHLIGAKDEKGARRIVRQGLLVAFLFGMLLLSIAAVISPFLPNWLGGEELVRHDASMYFLVYGLSLPLVQLNGIAGGMIQCSGNMKLPSILHILMCMLDVVFNMLLIFPSRDVSIFGQNMHVPGANLGVMGAALGTALAELVIVIIMLYFLLVKSKALHLRKDEKLIVNKNDLKKALKLGLPVGAEQFIMCSAYVVATKIVAPLGSIAIAANSFAVTAESLCYMPGYGIGHAATTLIGQSIGAKRQKLAEKLGWITTVFGMIIMAGSGVLMFIFAPFMIGLLSPDVAIRTLGTKILRIEAFAEPLYGASIIATGVFRGAGDTLVPCVLNFISMWCVRLPLSYVLSKSLGLQGVWLAMCIELCVRGFLFLFRMAYRSKKNIKSEN